MMPLSEEEQRLLEQMEEALAAEDPKFASALRGVAARSHHKRVALAAAVGFIGGVALLMTGVILLITAVSVAGFVVMLACAYIALSNIRRLNSAPDVPDNVHPISGAKRSGRPAAEKSGFMNRMEDRWRRRRNEY
jgi:hypothetical protein